MRLLLDTCTFIYIVSAISKLSPAATIAYQDPTNDVFLRAASTWEISVKYGSGKLILPSPPESCIPAYRAQHNISPLATDESATLLVHDLPAHHKDPFDRMLVCQALTQSLTIVTPNPLIQRYAVRCLC